MVSVFASCVRHGRSGCVIGGARDPGGPQRRLVFAPAPRQRFGMMQKRCHSYACPRPSRVYRRKGTDMAPHSVMRMVNGCPRQHGFNIKMSPPRETASLSDGTVGPRFVTCTFPNHVWHGDRQCTGSAHHAWCITRRGKTACPRDRQQYKTGCTSGARLSTEPMVQKMMRLVALTPKIDRARHDRKSAGKVRPLCTLHPAKRPEAPLRGKRQCTTNSTTTQAGDNA
jgi:hypothetical protein